MTDQIITHKHCTKCKRLKALDLFYKSKLGRGGRRTECKECSSSTKFSAKVKGHSDTDIARMWAQRKLRHEIKKIHSAQPGVKWCQSCKQFQARTAFSICRRYASGLQPYCKSCRAKDKANKREHYQAKAKEWRNRTVEQRKAYDAKYYATNKDRLLREFAKYRKRNKWKARRAAQEYYQRKKAQIIQRSRSRYQTKRAEILNKSHAYYRRHKQQYKEYARARSARRNKAHGFYTLAQWQDKLAYWGYRCYLCGTSLHSQSIHLEHRKPLIRGGSNWIANIAPACGSCNRRKHTKTESEFRALMAA